MPFFFFLWLFIKAFHWTFSRLVVFFCFCFVLKSFYQQSQSWGQLQERQQGREGSLLMYFIQLPLLHYYLIKYWRLWLAEMVEWFDVVTMYKHDVCFFTATVQSVYCCFPLILALGFCLTLWSPQLSREMYFPRLLQCKVVKVKAWELKVV